MASSLSKNEDLPFLLDLHLRVGVSNGDFEIGR
jgi:hypothetical protein